MPIELREATVFASGEVGVEDAEVLGEWLATGKVGIIEVSEVTHLHGAALQRLLQHRQAVVGVPKDRFTAQLLSALHDTGSEMRP